MPSRCPSCRRAMAPVLPWWRRAVGSPSKRRGGPAGARRRTAAGRRWQSPRGDTEQRRRARPLRAGPRLARSSGLSARGRLRGRDGPAPGARTRSRARAGRRGRPGSGLSAAELLRRAYGLDAGREAIASRSTAPSRASGTDRHGDTRCIARALGRAGQRQDAAGRSASCSREAGASGSSAAGCEDLADHALRPASRAGRHRHRPPRPGRGRALLRADPRGSRARGRAARLGRGDTAGSRGSCRWTCSIPTRWSRTCGGASTVTPSPARPWSPDRDLRIEPRLREERYLLLRRSEVSLCSANVGFPVELQVRAPLRTLTAWWRGDVTLTEARASGLIVEGNVPNGSAPCRAGSSVTSSRACHRLAGREPPRRSTFRTATTPPGVARVPDMENPPFENPARPRRRAGRARHPGRRRLRRPSGHAHPRRATGLLCDGPRRAGPGAEPGHPG